VREEVEARLRRNRGVTMKWIGVTQETGWPFVQNLILGMLDGRLGRGKLEVELAFLDPDGLICRGPGGPDNGQVGRRRKGSRGLSHNTASGCGTAAGCWPPTSTITVRHGMLC
jgi:hypothetical protein